MAYVAEMCASKVMPHSLSRPVILCTTCTDYTDSHCDTFIMIWDKVLPVFVENVVNISFVDFHWFYEGVWMLSREVTLIWQLRLKVVSKTKILLGVFGLLDGLAILSSVAIEFGVYWMSWMSLRLCAFLYPRCSCVSGVNRVDYLTHNACDHEGSVMSMMISTPQLYRSV